MIQHKPPLTWLCCVSIALTVMLTGCGSGGGKKEESSTTSSTPPVTALKIIPYVFPPTFAAESQADVSEGIKISLTPNDLPQGWKSTFPPSTTVPRNEILDEALVNCLFGAKPGDLTSYVVSSNYASPDSKMTMTSYTRSVSSKNVASKDFSNFTAERVEKCQSAMFERETTPPKGVQARDLFFRKYGKAPPPASMPVEPLALSDGSKDTKAFRMVVAPTDNTAVYQDIFGYGAGRWETVLVVEGPVQADIAIETAVMKNLKARTLAAALKG